MPSAPAYADLEFHLSAEASPTYRVDMRFRMASVSVDTHLVTGGSLQVRFDLSALTEVELDPDEYGQRLAGMLFADQRLREAFSKARNLAEGARQPLRVYLRLDVNDAALHALRWETLHDLEGGGRLFTSERVILSRYIDSPDTSPIDLRTPRQLRALVVVAAPTNLAEYGLAPIDVASEVARAGMGLGTFRPAVLTREETKTPVTLAALGQALHNGADLVYLVAHGKLLDGKPYLCLEREDGEAVWAEGNELVQQIAQLARRPLLIVLASCQSVGHSQDGGALAALGPQLAGRGLAAVIAMQGNVGADTVGQMIPILFRKLRETGQVDIALAAARAAVLHQPDWWMPVLFLRVPNGQIIEQPYVPEQHLPGPFRGAVVRMVEDYEAIFGGRDNELAILDAWLTNDSRPYAFLHAPTGRGKTALLIHWVARVQRWSEWSIVFVPLSLRYQTATAESVLGALATALAEFHGEREQLTTYNTSPDQLRPLIANYLRRSPDDSRRLLIVLDGLDEAVGWQIGRELFPREPGLHLRIVASARQRAQMTRVDWYEQLGWRAGQTIDLDLAGLRREAVSDILRRMANPLDALATNVNLLSEITRVSEGDPLTIRFLVEALKDGSLAPGQLVRLPPGLEAYLRAWYKELEHKSSRIAAVSTLLSLCAVALGPLTNDDLQRLAPEQLGQQDVLNQALEEVGRFIIGDGSEQSGYVFSHPRLREIFLEKVRSPAERRKILARFIADGQRLYDERVRPLPKYVRQFWVAHLVEANAWQQATCVLTEVVEHNGHVEQPWAAVRYAAEGSYAGYLADLDLLWCHVEQHGAFPIGLKCGLIMVSIRSLTGKLTPELLVKLVIVGTVEGQWSMAVALEHVRQMPDAQQQVAAIGALIGTGAPISHAQVLETVSAIRNEESRASAFGQLAPLLPAEQQPAVYQAALEAARAIRNEGSRASALGQLAPLLPAEQQPAVYQAALEAARAISYEGSRVSALGQLAPLLPNELLPAALEAARAISNEESRASALGQLAPLLPAEEQLAAYQVALEAARAIRNEESRASVLGQLAPLLPNELLPAALEAARAISNEESRASVLGQLAPLLPAEEQLAVYQAALEAARAIRNEVRRASALGQLAPLLPAEQQPAVYQAALEAARAIRDEESRASVLGQLAPLLPNELLPAALEAARAISNEARRASALGQLAPLLPAEQQPAVYQAALEAARAISHEESRASALGQLAPLLPAEQQPAVYQAALEAARAISHEERRVSALGQLAPLLPIELLPVALEAARAISNEESRASALGQLAPLLPTKLLPAALEAARAISNEESRASALGQLAPLLPVEEQLAVYQAALEVVRSIRDEESQAFALGQLAPLLPAEQQPAVYQAALEAARAIRNEWSRVSVLGQLAPLLPNELLPAALEAARAIRDEWGRASVLSQLALLLATELLPTALEAARAIRNEESRASVLHQLAPLLPAEQQPAVYQAALEAARTIDDEWSRASALGQLAPLLSAEEQPAVYQAALEAARTIRDEESRAFVLGQLAPLLPNELLPAALEVARAISNEGSRADALHWLAPQLPAEEQPAVYQAALEAARAISQEGRRVSALGQLIPQLPNELLHAALEITRTIRDEWSQASVLGQLAPLLPAEEQPVVYQAALEAARAISDEGSRASALGQLAPLLPAEQQLAVYQAALEAVRAIDHEWSRASALGQLIPQLPNELLHAALEAARAIRDEESRASALGQLAPLLPAEEQLVVYQAALKAARAIRDEERRASALGQLAPLLPAEEQLVVYQAALEAARAISQEGRRVPALGQLIPQLPNELLHAALEITRTIRDEWGRASVLGQLAPLLPAEEQPVVYQAALEAARAIRDEVRRASVFSQLAPLLPAEEQLVVYQAALEAARTIDDEWSRAPALGQLAPLLPSELLPAALEAACAINDEWSRASVLHQLVPHIATSNFSVQAWAPTLRTLALYGRSSFLTSLNMLTPWLVTLTTPEERARIAHTIIAVCRCWP